jgi:hypothetical protein
MEEEKTGHPGRRLKVVVQLIQAKKPYYIVRAYDSGRLIFQGKKIIKPEYVSKWFLYNQALLDQGFAVVKKRSSGGLQVVFGELAERRFKLFLLYVYSLLNIRSSRRADCLAKCWSKIDVVSPIVDQLWELSRMVEEKRFSSLLRGYCLCR